MGVPKPMARRCGRAITLWRNCRAANTVSSSLIRPALTWRSSSACDEIDRFFFAAPRAEHTGEFGKPRRFADNQSVQRNRLR
jgi:hypothetical protein